MSRMGELEIIVTETVEAFQNDEHDPWQRLDVLPTVAQDYAKQEVSRRLNME